MKIHFYPVDPVASVKRPPTLAEFADAHGLEMEVHERGPAFVNPLCRQFYAFFRSVAVEWRGVRCYEFGNGDSPAAAMMDYARIIEGKALVVDPDDPGKHRKIRAPKVFRSVE